jgi:hypothetical protein
MYADDVLFLVDWHTDLQVMLDIANRYLSRERYTLHSSKINMITRGNVWKAARDQWSLGDTSL